MNIRYVFILCAVLIFGGVMIIGPTNTISRADENTPIPDSQPIKEIKIEG